MFIIETTLIFCNWKNPEFDKIGINGPLKNVERLYGVVLVVSDNFEHHEQKLYCKISP